MKRNAFVVEKHGVRLIVITGCDISQNEMLGTIFTKLRNMQTEIADALGAENVRMTVLVDVHTPQAQKEQEAPQTREEKLLSKLQALGYTDEEAYFIVSEAAMRLFGGTIPHPMSDADEEKLIEHLFARPDRRTVDNLVEFYAEETNRRNFADASYDNFYTLLTELKHKVIDWLNQQGRTALAERLRGTERRIEKDWFICDYYFVRHLISTKQI